MGVKRKQSKLPPESRKKTRTAAIYTEVKITVPNAPVPVALPSAMTFYVDSRFTTAQVNRIKQMVGIVLGSWKNHYDQLNNGAFLSSYQNCVNKYARFNLAPVWFDETLANGAAAAAVQMDGLTTMIAANGFNRAPKAYIRYQASGASTIKGLNGSNPETDPLSVTINAIPLSKTSISIDSCRIPSARMASPRRISSSNW